MKKLHLVTEEGFLSRLGLNLVALTAIIFAVHSCDRTRWLVVDAYDLLKLKLLTTAHAVGWWSAIGMLSSSCCVIQVLLNLGGLGCAGFNAWLGPLRPTSMAVGVICQVISWSIAFSKPWQWGSMALLTAVSVLLTFSPEILAAYHSSSYPSNATANQKSTGKHQEVHIQLNPGAIGCISCVTTVKSALSALPQIVYCDVTTDGFVRVQISTSAPGVEGANMVDNILIKLAKAGFEGVHLLEATPKDSRPGYEFGEVDKWAGVLGSVVGGLLGSSCCLIQLVLNLLASLNILHIGCAGFNNILGPLRPKIRAATGVWLAGVWVAQAVGSLHIAPSGAKKAASCCSPPHRKWGRLVMISAVCALLTFLPELLLLSGGTALAPPTAGAFVVPLDVDGMGCEACQTHVKSVLERSSGVISATVDFKTGKAEVVVARDWSFDATQVSRNLEVDGFFLLKFGTFDSAEQQ
mmetsp:Transcript_5856/g.13558  ORF Transcript_5856/g.13558 Transcript_5856/m.13558 type:complete len:465 (-) Transcript_5856:75-1469(-)